jgi:hypothetical protein
LESMTMGRLLRLNYASIETQGSGKVCGAPGQAVCCASACALVYLGSAKWKRTDRLGLHRPTLQDLGEQDYERARDALQNASVLIREYLKEMEVSSVFFDAMMRASPEEIVVLPVARNYPPSMEDWLTSKCKSTSPQLMSNEEDRDFCMSSEFSSSFDPLQPPYDEARRFSWYSYKSKSELKSMSQDDAIGPIRQVAIEAELERRKKIPDADRSLVRTLTGHLEDINSISVSNDGRYAISGGSPPSVKLWDLSNGQEPRSLRGHYIRVLSVAMTPDGRYGLFRKTSG